MSKFQLFSIKILLLSFMVFGSISVYRGQDNNWDLKNYHYYNPYSFFNNRLDFDYAPAQAHTYLNPAADFMFYFFVVTFPPMLVGFLMGGVHGLNFWLLFLISYYTLKKLYHSSDPGETKKLYDNAGENKSHDLFKQEKIIIGLSLLIGVVGLYGPITNFELGLSFNDNLVSLFILGAILVLVHKMVLEKNYSLIDIKKELIISGILAGIAIGLKFTQVSYGVGLVFAIGAFTGDRRAKLISISLLMVSIALGVFISSGYWMIIMWTKFENPIFPFYNEIFRSPYYTQNNLSILTLNSIPNGLIKNTLYPFYILFDPDYKGGSPLHIRDARYAIVYSLVILTVFQKIMVYFRRGNNNEEKKSTFLLTRISLSLLLFFTAIFPIMDVKSTLDRRLLAQDITSFLPYVNLFAYLFYLLIVIIVFLFVRNMNLQPRSVKEINTDGRSKQIVLFFQIFCITSFITWQAMFSIHRYLSPLEILSPLLIVILLVYLVQNMTLRYWFVIGSFILIGFSVEGPLPKIISWDRSFFRVKVPEIDQLDSSIVFMAGKDPIAYLIPFFPPKVRFIRLESYFKFNNPGVQTKFHDEINKLIQNHDGSFFLLSRWMHFPRHEQLLKDLGLRIVDPNKNESILSEHEPAGLRLWAARKEMPTDNVVR